MSTRRQTFAPKYTINHFWSHEQYIQFCHTQCREFASELCVIILLMC